ncbi:MAG: hypothetical protein AAF799_35570 [Myxococcota bacterium]
MSLLATLVGVGISCVVEPSDDRADDELEAASDESADDGDPLELPPGASALASDAEPPNLPPSLGCPGGCNNPPPCRTGPGVCQNDPFSGPTCWYPPVFNGSGCDDGNECTFSECIEGYCTSLWSFTGQACDDGDSATVDDECNALGACEGTVACPGGCDDPPVCQQGPGVCVVDPFGGSASCSYAPVFIGATCDTGFQCTIGECFGGGCATTGYAPRGTPCDDGDPCTAMDRCLGGGVCTGKPTLCAPIGGGPVPS